MFVTIGVGIFIGILLVIGALRLTMREDPLGCLVIIGAMAVLVIETLILIFKTMFGG
ncbi:MAG TPA: hypothetical protein VGD99_24470 [Anaerolineae bacterium]